MLSLSPRLLAAIASKRSCIVTIRAPSEVAATANSRPSGGGDHGSRAGSAGRGGATRSTRGGRATKRPSLALCLGGRGGVSCTRRSALAELSAQSSQLDDGLCASLALASHNRPPSRVACGLAGLPPRAVAHCRSMVSFGHARSHTDRRRPVHAKPMTRPRPKALPGRAGLSLRNSGLRIRMNASSHARLQQRCRRRGATPGDRGG